MAPHSEARTHDRLRCTTLLYLGILALGLSRDFVMLVLSSEGLLISTVTVTVTGSPRRFNGLKADRLSALTANHEPRSGFSRV